MSTDNHVGYAELDPIRKEDSWRSFDEVMTIARERDVDMVLLAGDLFHDNSMSQPRTFVGSLACNETTLAISKAEELLMTPNCD